MYIYTTLPKPIFDTTPTPPPEKKELNFVMKEGF